MIVLTVLSANALTRTSVHCRMKQCLAAGTNICYHWCHSHQLIRSHKSLMPHKKREIFVSDNMNKFVFSWEEIFLLFCFWHDALVLQSCESCRAEVSNTAPLSLLNFFSFLFSQFLISSHSSSSLPSQHSVGKLAGSSWST